MRVFPLLSFGSASAIVSSRLTVSLPRGWRVCHHIGLMMLAQEAIGEFRDHAQRLLGSLPVWGMACMRQQRYLDRAIALRLRHFDLPHRAILVLLALHDENGYADVRKRVPQIETAEARIEPWATPVVNRH